MKASHIISTVAALAALQLTPSQASSVSQSDPLAGGITYFWNVQMGATDSAIFQHHVGAWSWEDDSLFAPGDDPVGWTHTSNWVALTLDAPTTLTVRLEVQAGVPWPSGSNPGRLASTANMFPSFTLWSGWDNDLAPQAFADANNGGDPTPDWHTYNNDGAVEWAEDLTYLGHVNNSSQSFAELTFALPAGQYSIVLGSNATANDTDRQGYRATLTTVPEPASAVLLLGGLGLLGLRRRRVGTANLALAAAGALLLLPFGAQAHLSYGGRNFGTFAGGEAPVTITNQNVSGAFGWADGTDADWGDSHRDRIFRFTLANTATVSITVQSIAYVSGVNTFIAGLLPGFSVYSGLAHTTGQADHDFSTLSQDYLASLPAPVREGVFNALGDFKIGSDDGVTFADLSSFTFMGYAVDGTAANFGSTPGLVGDGLADGTVTGSFTLPAGDYSFLVGGADYAAGIGAVAPFQGYGISTTITATPEPTTTLMLAAGLATLGLRRGRALAA